MKREFIGWPPLCQVSHCQSLPLTELCFPITWPLLYFIDKEDLILCGMILHLHLEFVEEVKDFKIQCETNWIHWSLVMEAVAGAEQAAEGRKPGGKSEAMHKKCQIHSQICNYGIDSST